MGYGYGRVRCRCWAFVLVRPWCHRSYFIDLNRVGNACGIFV